MLVCATLLLGLTACQPPDSNPAHSATAQYHIDNGTIYIATAHIITIKPERYQPSIGLQGTTLPIDQTTLTSPEDMIITEVMVQPQQTVKKGQVLLRLHMPVSTETPTSTPTSLPSEYPAPISEPQVDQQIPIEKNNQEKNDTQPKPSVDSVKNDAEQLDEDEQKTSQPFTPDISNTDLEASLLDDYATQSSNQIKPGDSLTIKAPFAGVVDQMYITHDNTPVLENQPLIKISNPNALQFVSIVPNMATSQIQRGQHVSFWVDGLTQSFTGQVSNILPHPRTQGIILTVHVIADPNNPNSNAALLPGMNITGRIDYGQIQVGTLVPVSAIHDADLHELQQRPYQPLLPLTANVWMVDQNHFMTQQQVEVISFNPKTGQYLIAGVSQDSLIVLVDLPAHAAGKTVKASN